MPHLERQAPKRFLRQSFHRDASHHFARLAPQTKSLTPERLLNTLTDNETRDLLAFLENLGVASSKP